MTITNEGSELGTIVTIEINESDEEIEGYSTGVLARYEFPHGEETRSVIAETESEALRYLADRVEALDAEPEQASPVRVTNNLVPVGLFEDYTEDETAPERDVEGGDE